MKKRIFIGIIGVAIPAVVASFVLLMWISYHSTQLRVVEELKNEASYIVQGIEADGSAYLDRLSGLENRITWVGPDGSVLFDSKSEPAVMENHGQREEIAAAFQTGEGQSIRASQTLDTQTIYYARLLPDGTVLRISSEQSTVYALTQKIMLPGIFIVALILLCALFCSYAIAGKIVLPIHSLNLSHPEQAQTYDELSPLIVEIVRQNRRIQQQFDELRRQQEEFQMITENMQEGFLIIDSKMDLLSCNPSALRLLGISSVAEHQSVFALNRNETFLHAVETALHGSRNEQPLALGAKRYHILANPVLQKQEVTGVIVFILDVTEKEQREKLRREFTSNVSHELKTPLTTIYGVSDMLSAGLVKPADIPGFAQSIKDESSRLIALIDDIIRLSQLDEGEIPIEKEAVDLYRLASSVLQRLEPAAQKQNISLSLTGSSAVFFGIRPVLEEMLYNLCDNAIKYNREGGSVTVAVTKTEQSFELSVSDTGIGIAPQDIDRIFERFYRVDKSHSRNIGGTGLGLSIVKHAVSMHNGTISVQSTEDQGTTIAVHFPAP